MKKIHAVIALLFISGLTGCMNNNGLHRNMTGESWKNQSTISLKKLDNKNKASVYFYRDGEQQEGKTINIFVDQQYLTSLLPGAVKQIELCPGGHSFTAHKTDVPEQYQVKLATQQLFSLENGKIYYFKLSNHAGGLTFDEIPPADITVTDTKASLQVHTLPRVNNEQQCL